MQLALLPIGRKYMVHNSNGQILFSDDFIIYNLPLRPKSRIKHVRFRVEPNHHHLSQFLKDPE